MPNATFPDDTIPSVFRQKVAVRSPVSGRGVALSALPSPLYQNGLWGPGHAVSTSSNQILSPFAGKVVKVDPLDYAVILKADNGIQLKIKVGVSTTGLLGEKCQFLVKQGDSVTHAQPLFAITPAWLKQHGVDPVCIVTALNADKAKAVVPSRRSVLSALDDALFTVYV